MQGLGRADDPLIVKCPTRKQMQCPVNTYRKSIEAADRIMNELSFIAMMDNGGRRLWSDRRKKLVVIAISERRTGKDRRTGIDRRGFQTVKVGKDKERRRKLSRLPTNGVK